MKKILLTALLFLSLMVCFTSTTWAGGLDDFKAGEAAFQAGNDDAAIRLLTTAIASGELDREQLKTAYKLRGNAWINKGNKGYYDKGYYDRAIADYNKALEIHPRFAYAYNDRGYSWAAKGDYDKAIADYTKAIEIDPEYAAAYNNRGNAWRKKGDYDKAIADYTKALEIDPKHVNAYNSLAWLMATCPIDRYRDGKRAVALAEKALELKETPSILSTMAAAYAEAGRFQEAIKTQEKAITELKKSTTYEKDLSKCEQHLSSYKAGKPWREK